MIYVWPKHHPDGPFTNWWLSCRHFTVMVQTDKYDIVRGAAPVVSRFIGQPLSNLETWFKRLGGLEKHAMKS